MHVSDLHMLTSAEYCELRAKVHSQLLAEPFVLWYRFPRAYQRFLDLQNGNPFVPALLVLAIRAGEPLEIPAPVSARLSRTIGQIQATYRSFDPSLFEVVVNARIVESGRTEH